MNKSIYSTYFSRNQLILLISIILLGIFFRFYSLDQRPLHHDESLHYMYSVYPIDNPATGFYKYDPMLHGPMLYTLQPFIFETFGISIQTSRILPAIIGSLLIFIPLLLRSYLCAWSVIASTAFLAFSPSLVYWSRFFIHDLFAIFGMALVLIGTLNKNKPYISIIISLGFVFLFGSKENSYVTLAILLGYMIYEPIFVYFFKTQECNKLTNKILSYAKEYKKQTCASVLFFCFCFCFLYTSGFRFLGPTDQGIFESYFGAIIDGLYRKSVGYWIGQDSIERIKGPYLFHFQLYMLYEVAFILIYFAQIYFFILRAEKKILNIAWVLLLVYFLTALYHFHFGIENSKFTTIFKLKDNFDIAGFFLFVSQAVLLTSDHLLKNEAKLAIFAYLFTANLFTYSYLGEKVPWLSQYPIYFGALYFPLYFKHLYELNYFNKFFNFELNKLISALGYIAITIGVCFAYQSEQIDYLDRFVLGLGAFLLITSLFIDKENKINLVLYIFIFLTFFTIRSTILTNFVFSGGEGEIMSQVHTTYEFDSIMKRIRNEIESKKIGSELSVYAAGEPIWPMTAYLQGLKGHKYQIEPEQYKTMCYLFDTRDTANFTAPQEFEKKEVTLRGWWLPDMENITLKKYLIYVINHTPWNPPGFSYANMYINHDPICGNSHK